jgi:hypothetical protein
MQITLTTNRTISLVRLNQSLTYRGLLAGIPYREGNQHYIERALEKAHALCMEGLEPHLIPPVATPVPWGAPPTAYLERTGLTAEQHQAQWQARHHETLPAVTCIGAFDSDELNRPGSEPYSSMVIVWFQDEFAAPIDLGVQAQIERLDWEWLAKDWIW